MMQTTWRMPNGSTITFDMSEGDQPLTLTKEEAASLGWIPVQANGHGIAVPVEEEG